MAKVNLVICMAGYNTRFHDVGFDIPKYLLPWANATIIQHILKNFDGIKQTILVANKRDAYFKEQLIATIKPLGLEENNILYIGDTKGKLILLILECHNWMIRSYRLLFIMLIQLLLIVL